MKNKKIIIPIVLMIILVGIILINYDNTEHTVLTDEERVISSSSSISMMLETGTSTGMYEVSNDTSWPTSGYTFNESLSKCENGSTLSWDSTTGAVTVSGNVSDRCYVYFDVKEPSYTISEILATKQISERTDFSVAFTDDTTGIIYETTDNDGTTYYWAGDATDNYVYFAGFYWRIVRVNGDGTLRLIYDGSEQAYENGVSNTDRAIGKSVYNSGSYSYYVGYTYTAGQQRPDEKNGGTDSTIKTYVDGWYSDNLDGTEYEKYIYQSGKFCNDRGGSYSNLDATYNGYTRLLANDTPSLLCESDIDEYTLNIGLITADEVVYAGGTSAYMSSEIDYKQYLAGVETWTMTPIYVNDGNSYVFTMKYFGNISAARYENLISSSLYVKPVINLNYDVIFKGDGTIDSPYEVSGK